MKILFQSIKYKNLLSSGNAWTKVELDKNRTTLISGTNGSGKSTLLDAIVFALYGKAFRKVNKNQLINTINAKETLVEVNFKIGKNTFMIRRGIKPNVFEIWKNEELLNQDAASKDYQAYLEQNILNLNFKSFNQIVILGSATYVPFMELPTGTRRDIIEDLLDIQVFSTMNTLLKDRVSSNKDSINENSYQMDLTESKLESAKEHNKSIRAIKTEEVDKIKEKMSLHIDAIEKAKTIMKAQNATLDIILDDIEDKPEMKAKSEKAKSLRRDIESQIRSHKKEVSFYHDNDDCPTCKQGIEHSFKASIIVEKDEKIIELEEGLEKLAVKAKTYDDRLESISVLEDQMRDINLAIGDQRATIKVAKNALVSYKNELDKAEEEVQAVDASTIETHATNLKKFEVDQQELFNHKEILTVVSAMLKDGGIKTRIIRQYIPVMNKLINKYLGAFDLFVDFQLDENFNETIKSRFRDTFSYASFSEGEKLRISLSIMLAWRAVAKLRNSVATNLLLLDETLDGALDGVGIENLIDTLHNLNSDDNIFVISHRGDQFGDKFDHHLNFKKVKNFSEISS
jgi:DNA repair exonuclease SbcCD ATPase subunit